ncbi:unnamed protein product [Brassica rapa subsp. trilocularis]
MKHFAGWSLFSSQLLTKRKQTPESNTKGAAIRKPREVVVGGRRSKSQSKLLSS